jgi:hypothetical protein
MAGSWKKSWFVHSYPDAVIRMIKLMPRVYEDGAMAGIVGWMGRTYSHQRKDFRPKSPKLSVDKGERLVFQHDHITPITYTVQVEEQDGRTLVEIEVKTSGSSRDTTPGEQVVTLLFALTKALEPN